MPSIMGNTELRQALTSIGDMEYDVDTAIMGLLLINYKLMEVIKEKMGASYLSYLLDETQCKLDTTEGSIGEDIMDCSLNNLAALRTIALYESRHLSRDLCGEYYPLPTEQKT